MECLATMMICVLIALLATATTSLGECDATEVIIRCPNDSYVLRAIASQNSFFSDRVAPACSNMEERIFGENMQQYIFSIPDDGLPLEVRCPHPQSIITEFNACITEGVPFRVTLQCNPIEEPWSILERWDELSDKMMHMMVDCKENATVSGIKFEDGGYGSIKVIFNCVKLQKY